MTKLSIVNRYLSCLSFFQFLLIVSVYLRVFLYVNFLYMDLFTLSSSSSSLQAVQAFTFSLLNFFVLLLLSICLFSSIYLSPLQCVFNTINSFVFFVFSLFDVIGFTFFLTFISYIDACFILYSPYLYKR